MERSDWKPCFRAKTWKYGFSSFRSCRIVLGRFGWIVSRRSSQRIRLPSSAAIMPSREYSDVVRRSTDSPVFSMKKRRMSVPYEKLSELGYRSIVYYYHHQNKLAEIPKEFERRAYVQKKGNRRV